MSYSNKFYEDLKDLDIEIKGKTLITDEKMIETFDNLIYNHQPLPVEISYEVRYKEPISDIKAYEHMDSLPVYIGVNSKTIDDLDEIYEIEDYFDAHQVLPPGIKKDIRNIDGNVEEVYTREKETYYKKHFSYYKTEYYQNEDLGFAVELKKRTH